MSTLIDFIELAKNKPITKKRQDELTEHTDILDRIVSIIRTSKSEHNNINMVALDLVSNYLPGFSYKKYIHGSMVTGLNIHGFSDADCVIVPKDITPQEASCIMLKNINLSSIYIVKLINLESGIPLLQITRKSDGCRVDITFKTIFTNDHTTVINSLLDKYKNARAAIIILKYIFMINNMNNAYYGGIRSYALCIIVFHVCRIHSIGSACNTSTKKILLESLSILANMNRSTCISYEKFGHCSELYIEDLTDKKNNIGKNTHKFSIIQRISNNWIDIINNDTDLVKLHDCLKLLYVE